MLYGRRCYFQLILRRASAYLMSAIRLFTLFHDAAAAMMPRC